MHACIHTYIRTHEHEQRLDRLEALGPAAGPRNRVHKHKHAPRQGALGEGNRVDGCRKCVGLLVVGKVCELVRLVLGVAARVGRREHVHCDADLWLEGDAGPQNVVRVQLALALHRARERPPLDLEARRTDDRRALVHLPDAHPAEPAAPLEKVLGVRHHATFLGR